MKNRSLGEKSKENRGRIRTTREREREREGGRGEGDGRPGEIAAGSEMVAGEREENMNSCYRMCVGKRKG
jgi:hypothetical protein